MPELRSKQCLRCGTRFGCGSASKTEACWCAELPPIMPVTEEGCLCPKCLREEIEGLLREAGLCASCGHAKRLRAKGGAILYQCGLSAEDPRFSKYPRLPMSLCPGYKKPSILTQSDPL